MHAISDELYLVLVEAVQMLAEEFGDDPNYVLIPALDVSVAEKRDKLTRWAQELGIDLDVVWSASEKRRIEQLAQREE